MLLGCCGYLLLAGRFKPLMLVVGIFSVVAGTTIAVLGDIYRWNTLVAPTVNAVSLVDSAKVFLPAAALSLFFWSCIVSYPLLVCRHVSANVGVAELWRAAFRTPALTPYTTLMCVVILGGGLSFIALGKTGSSLNHMFETLVAASSLSSAVIVKLSAFEKKWRLYQNLAAIGVALLCAVPIAQIVLNGMGPITRVTKQEALQKREFAHFLQNLPNPLFISDEIYALPWHSNNGSYPAVTIDPVYYYAAKEKGLLEGGGLKKLVENRCFGSLILLPGDDLIETALDAGYFIASPPTGQVSFTDAFNVKKTGTLFLLQQQQTSEINEVR
jgi:hypothetical protein